MTCPATIKRAAFAGAFGAYLAGSVFGQIVTNGMPYECEGSTSFARTNNNSLDVTLRSATCSLPTSMGHWFDLSIDPELACAYVYLTCVDFSIWSSSNTGFQPIFVRVYRDTTPHGRSDVCGTGDTPGPDTASLVLIEERTVSMPPSSEGVAQGSPGRTDGDLSVSFRDGSWDPGLLIEPDTALFIEVGHLGQAVTRFGCNDEGEAGDATNGPRQTWVKAPNCGGGGCVSFAPGQWTTHAEWTPPNNRDFVLRAHFEPDLTQLPRLTFCPEDIAGDDDAVDVMDLLDLLADWGTVRICTHPRGDVAPIPWGDGVTDVTDLLALLGAWGPCPHSIQRAIDEASPGELVLVPPGTYEEIIDLRGKAITLRGEAGPEQTIIDGSKWDGSVVTCVSGESVATVIEGFTIRGGRGERFETSSSIDPIARRGGGMLLIGASPQISNCILRDNVVEEAYWNWRSQGAGIHVEAGSPLIQDCSFIDNRANSHGGGIYCIDSADLRVIGCTFLRSEATFPGDGGSGGGIHAANSTVWIESCHFEGCHFDSIFLTDSTCGVSQCSFRQSDGVVGFRSNLDVEQSTLERTDGIGLVYSTATMRECLFLAGGSSYGGAGFYNASSSIVAWNCLFVGNVGWYADGGAIVCDRYDDEDVCTLDLINCTLVGNDATDRGGAIAVLNGAEVNVFNCVLWGNTDNGEVPWGRQVFFEAPSAVQLVHCNIDGGWAWGGYGNIDADPLFLIPPDPGPDGWWGSWDDNLGDLRLGDGSSCFNAGLNDAFTFCPIDLEHRQRFAGGIMPRGWSGKLPPIDIGAFEYGADPAACPPE